MAASPQSTTEIVLTWTDTSGNEAGIAQMNESFQKMRVNVMDLMQIHNLRDWKVHLETLRRWKQEGKVRYVGITTSHQRYHDELEQIMTEWCRARTQAEVIDAFTAAEAAIGPVYDMADIAVDPHYAARGAIADVGGTPMQGLIARLSATPGQLRWPGRPLDADGDAIRTSGWP